eukprot:1884108-Pyramimonas_sp.AAC.1
MTILAPDCAESRLVAILGATARVRGFALHLRICARLRRSVRTRAPFAILGAPAPECAESRS